MWNLPKINNFLLETIRLFCRESCFVLFKWGLENRTGNGFRSVCLVCGFSFLCGGGGGGGGGELLGRKSKTGVSCLSYNKWTLVYNGHCSMSLNISYLIWGFLFLILHLVGDLLSEPLQISYSPKPFHCSFYLLQSNPLWLICFFQLGGFTSHVADFHSAILFILMGSLFLLLSVPLWNLRLKEGLQCI